MNIIKLKKNQIVLFLGLLIFISYSCKNEPDKKAPKKSYAWKDLSKEDQGFLDLVQHKAFDFFWEGFDENTGLIYDGHSKNRRTSVATSGFGLSAFIVGVERGWITKDEAYKRILLTLNSYYKDPNNPDDFCVEGKYGFFYHFFNIDTGKRNGKSEVSTIDTAILMAGVLDVMEYFKGTEVAILADKIYKNAQWDKYINEEKAVVGGWRPEMKPVAVYKGYNEYNLVYLLGLGSPTYTLPDASWSAWASGKGFIPIKPYNDIGEFLTPHGVLQPLAYIYQFPACWYDFRNKSDDYVDYYKMSINALKANKEYTNSWGYAHGYPEELWGWTAIAGRDGYLGFSHPYNGTLAPSAVLASLSFIPEESLRAIKYMYQNYGDKIFKEYGFVDSFNPYQNWYDDTYLGIDKGNEVLSIENYRSGSIWKRFMDIPYVQTGMKKAKFKNL
ncbi:glucoamylase family protein [Tamlana sp. 2201CG12-4]|uniref:glucoamylase family protein n=1 Tax=Tamlana sp. 2201CG12-4 TaxID=3112582 RepID=UPI002DB9A044|nr:glucoamylase family protein [Tamlana sp. 2201CG12-4]MEC3905719.1 glucoamylase family protein [Tamlana sp. 2201CG12-4]